jgi:hypothetical protein
MRCEVLCVLPRDWTSRHLRPSKVLDGFKGSISREIEEVGI